MPQDSDSGDTKISMAKANRKIAKPIMEKKRRARINASLNELKTLLVEVLQKEGCRHSSKMEKADILEMAVRHLKNLQKQQTFPGVSTPSLRDSYPPAIPIEKYASSLSPECLTPEIKRFFGRIPSDTKPPVGTTPTSPDSTVTSQSSIRRDSNHNIVAAPQPININTAPSLPISGVPASALPGNVNTITQPMMTRTATGEIAVVLPPHLLKQAAASQPNSTGGLILPIYTLQQTPAQQGTDIKSAVSPQQGAVPHQQPVMISINMPTLQQSQCSAFTSLPSSSSSSSTTSSIQSSQQSPVSPVWRPW